MTDRGQLQTVTLAGEEYVVVPRAEYDALRTAAQEEISDATLLMQSPRRPGRGVGTRRCRKTDRRR